MEIKTVALKPEASRSERISLIASAIIDMKVKLPNIVATLAMITETSPWHGEVRLYDAGFHAHWEDSGKGAVLLELTQTEQE